MLKELQIFGGYVGDAHCDSGIAKQGDYYAVAVDALYLALDACKGTIDYLDSLTFLVNKMIVGKGYALGEWVRAIGRIDEILHLTVWNPDNLGRLGHIMLTGCHELHDVAVGGETLQQFQLNFHGMDEHHIINGALQGVFTGIAKIVFRYFLKMKVCLVSLCHEGVVDRKCALSAAITDVHRIPAKEGIVGFFQESGIIGFIVVETEAALLSEEL